MLYQFFILLIIPTIFLQCANGAADPAAKVDDIEAILKGIHTKACKALKVQEPLRQSLVDECIYNRTIAKTSLDVISKIKKQIENDDALLRKMTLAETRLQWTIGILNRVIDRKVLTPDEERDIQALAKDIAKVESEIEAIRKRKVDHEVAEMLRMRELQKKLNQQREEAIIRIDEIAELNGLDPYVKEFIVRYKWGAIEDDRLLLNPEEISAVQGFLLKEEILQLGEELKEFEQSLSPQQLAEFVAACGES